MRAADFHRLHTSLRLLLLSFFATEGSCDVLLTETKISARRRLVKTRLRRVPLSSVFSLSCQCFNGFVAVLVLLIVAHFYADAIFSGLRGTLVQSAWIQAIANVSAGMASWALIEGLVFVGITPTS